MRLIDADALKECLKEKMYGHPFERKFLSSVVDSEPTIDAVPVVRCRECKYMIPQSHTRYCTVWNAVNGMGDDGFCNYGERKEGAD